MKKFLLFMLAVIFTTVTLQAEKKQVDIRFQRTNPGPISGSIERSPLIIPVTVTADDFTGELEVSNTSGLSGAVYVYTLSGSLERSAQSLNTRLYLPYTKQTHIISLQGTDWIGEGRVIY